MTMATADTIAAGATVTVAYDQPTSNALADAASNEVESFTGTDAIAALNRPAAPVVTLTAGDGQLTAAWAAPANGGSAITELRRGVEDRRPDLGSGRDRRAVRHGCRRRHRP